MNKLINKYLVVQNYENIFGPAGLVHMIEVTSHLTEGI